MPRGKRKTAPKTIDERISALEQELQALRETVSAKEAELKQLQETRDQEMIQTLMDVIAQSGKSVQDVIEMVQGGEKLDEQPQEE